MKNKKQLKILITFLVLILTFTGCKNVNIEKLSKNSHIDVVQNANIEFIGINSSEYFIGYAFGISEDVSTQFIRSNSVGYELYDICFKVTTNSNGKFSTASLLNKVTISDGKNTYKSNVFLEKNSNLGITHSFVELAENSKGYLHFVTQIPKEDIEKDFKLQIKKDDKNKLEYMVNIKDSPVEKNKLMPNEYLKNDDKYVIQFNKAYITDIIHHSERKDKYKKPYRSSNKFAVLEFDIESKIDKTEDVRDIMKATFTLPNIIETQMTCEYKKYENNSTFNIEIYKMTKTKMYVYAEISPDELNNVAVKIVVDDKPYYYEFK